MKNEGKCPWKENPLLYWLELSQPPHPPTPQYRCDSLCWLMASPDEPVIFPACG